MTDITNDQHEGIPEHFLPALIFRNAESLVTAIRSGVLVLASDLSAEQRAEASREIDCATLMIDFAGERSGFEPAPGSQHLRRNYLDELLDEAA